MNNIKDVIIIGRGPAGVAAGIYAKRAGLDALIIDKNYMSGGQIQNTYEIDNYPGFIEFNGFDFSMKLDEHLKKFGIEEVMDEVTNLNLEGEIKEVSVSSNTYKTKNVILCLGAKPRKLKLLGETKYFGKGVSYCATCDGAFYKNKTVLVNGGGDVAVEDAIFLSRICAKVYVVLRRDEFRATKILQEELLEKENVEIIYNHIVTDINGDDLVKSCTVKNVQTSETREISVDGVFVAIGTEVNLIGEKEYSEYGLLTNDNGYINALEDCRTNIKNVYVAGDLRTKALRQVVTAVSDGALAINSLLSDK